MSERVQRSRAQSPESRVWGCGRVAHRTLEAVFAKVFEHGAHQRETHRSHTEWDGPAIGDRAPRRESDARRRARRTGALQVYLYSVYTCVHRIVRDMDHIVGVSHTPGTALPSRPRPAALSAKTRSLTLDSLKSTVLSQAMRRRDIHRVAVRDACLLGHLSVGGEEGPSPSSASPWSLSLIRCVLDTSTVRIGDC